jgi:GPH family glycoside/pentoside/hexuronide:cation symporter
MGRISDRTRSRYGRRRPYLLAGAIPVGLTFALLFGPPPGLEGPALAAWFTGSLLAVFTATTVTQVPILALMPELAGGYDARTRLSAAREVLGNVGDLAGLLLPVLLAMALGAGRGTTALAATLVGASATLALLGTWAGTRERPPKHAAPSAPLLRELRSLFGPRPVRQLFAAGLLVATALAFAQAMFLYVLAHVLRADRPEIHLAAFLTYVAAALVSFPLWTRYAAARAKPAALRLGLLLTAGCFLPVLAAGPGDVPLLLGVMAVNGAANVGVWMLLHSLAADLTDLDALEHGTRREGLFAGTLALVKKAAFALAAVVIGVGLHAIGYAEGGAPPPALATRLQWLFALPPTVLTLAAMAVFRDYGMTREASAAVGRRLRPGSSPVPRGALDADLVSPGRDRPSAA